MTQRQWGVVEDGRQLRLDGGPEQVEDRRHKRSVDREDHLSTSAVLELYRSTVSPTREVIEAEDLDRFWRALEQLPAEQRRLIGWIHLDGMPREEVAARLGKSRAALNSALARAMARLARLLRDG